VAAIGPHTFMSLTKSDSPAPTAGVDKVQVAGRCTRILYFSNTC